MNTQTLQQVGDGINRTTSSAQTQPRTDGSLDRLFGNDIVALDANPTAPTSDREPRRPLRLQFTIGSPSAACDGKPAERRGGQPGWHAGLHDNEVNYSVTALNLVDHSVITRDIPSSEPPRRARSRTPCWWASSPSSPPSASRKRIPVHADSQLRPLQFRGKQSDTAGQLRVLSPRRPGGHVPDLAAGPSQTLPLDSFFARTTRGPEAGALDRQPRSNSDFNANSRGVQGGCGFASDDFAPAGQCLAPFAAGGGPATLANPTSTTTASCRGRATPSLPTRGSSPGSVRLQQPQPADAARSRAGGRCSRPLRLVHGGRVTKSQIFHRDIRPSTAPGPAGVTPPTPVRGVGPLFCPSRVDEPAVPSTVTIKYLEDVGTSTSGMPRGSPERRHRVRRRRLRPRRAHITITRRTCTMARRRPSTRSSRCTGWGRHDRHP